MSFENCSRSDYSLKQLKKHDMCPKMSTHRAGHFDCFFIVFNMNGKAHQVTTCLQLITKTSVQLLDFTFVNQLIVC